MCRSEVNWFGRVGLLIEIHGGCDVLYFHRVVETLNFARSDVALEWGDCCGERVVCAFVSREVGGKDCECVSLLS